MKYMKKLFFLLTLFCVCPAFAEEPLLLINPSRETIVNFPSSVLPQPRVVTVFLPEPSVPLHGKYPAVYLLGAGPKDAEAAKEALARSERKAVLVGLNFEEKELNDIQAVRTFITREVIPYIETNYPVFDEPALRAVAGYGPAGAHAVADLLERGDVFARGVLASPGNVAAALPAGARVLLSGKREELVVWQAEAEKAGLAFGPGFITLMEESADLLSSLDLDYLFASAEQVGLRSLNGAISPASLYLSAEQEAFLSVAAVLNNGLQAQYIPLSVRLSPPYLNWNAAAGTLAPISGATPGTVKISVFAGKKYFDWKIRLKK